MRVNKNMSNLQNSAFSMYPWSNTKKTDRIFTISCSNTHLYFYTLIKENAGTSKSVPKFFSQIEGAMYDWLLSH